MVAALRPGGLIIEQSPFSEEQEAHEDENGTDTRLHTSRHGVTMAQAMGPLMRLMGGTTSIGKGVHLWRKQGPDGLWNHTCCISGFTSECKEWKKRCK